MFFFSGSASVRYVFGRYKKQLFRMLFWGMFITPSPGILPFSRRPIFFFCYHWPFTMMIDNNVKTNSYLTIKKKTFQNKPWRIAHFVWAGIGFCQAVKARNNLLPSVLEGHSDSSWGRTLCVFVCSKLPLQTWAKLTPLDGYPQITSRTILDGFWAQSYSLWATKICSPSLLDTRCSAKMWRILTLI